ncbi:hypothetical protein LIER_36404 [Lithospermum erythrorhizon]|uniref:Uncharacterized protein n=1 Tax=Lithospermum erythrorhizon TaxID=34254 RepID=A0AAV3P5K5_LITER
MKKKVGANSTNTVAMIRRIRWSRGRRKTRKLREIMIQVDNVILEEGKVMVLWTRDKLAKWGVVEINECSFCDGAKQADHLLSSVIFQLVCGEMCCRGSKVIKIQGNGALRVSGVVESSRARVFAARWEEL